MKRHALFVGINDYADKAFKNLRYSLSDALALSLAFGRKGFETDILSNPKSEEILNAVERATTGLGPGDVFLFFFAGHGYTADGSHLLICADDKLSLLRYNRAGIPVELLEEVTNGRGFHRAFLLDACRTDVFAGVDSRGAETRDLALVSLPDAKVNAGTCCVLRSCDRFCPAMEFEDLGHGVFTRAVMDVVGDDSACATPFGEAFVSDIRSRMRDIIAAHGVPTDQNPCFQTNGEAFFLFDAPANARLNTPSPSTPVIATPLVVCPLCGKKNRPEDTFKCRECGKDNLCLRHKDKENLLCSDCARKARELETRLQAEKAARIAEERRARQERREREEGGERHPGDPHRAGDILTMTAAGVSFNLRWIPANGTQPAFWLGETPVTQELWGAVMGKDNDNFDGNTRPFEYIHHDEWIMFLNNLNKLASVHATGMTFRLPTCEEWDFACRAGGNGKFGRLKDGREGSPDEIAWHVGNSGSKTHPVGLKSPNAWGLFDMHGNVWECVLSNDGSSCYVKGGSYFYAVTMAEAGRRKSLEHTFLVGIGLRLAADDRGKAPKANRVPEALREAGTRFLNLFNR